MSEWNVMVGLAIPEEGHPTLTIMDGVMLAQLRHGSVALALFEDERLAVRVAQLLNEAGV